MSISFKAPHLPFTPDPIDLKLYESMKTFTRPQNFGVGADQHKWQSPGLAATLQSLGHRVRAIHGGRLARVEVNLLVLRGPFEARRLRRDANRGVVSSG